jgi:regulator of sirC expression with transglutaminase-like and TPR domain
MTAAGALGDSQAECGRASPLLVAAAELPRYAEPGCEPQRVLDQVHTWAAQLRVRVAPDASPFARLRLLNHFFFGELGFTGAGDDYQTPQNSYLHRVVERRRGIPITLSILYMELGRAAGLKLDGVPFPGHFLVSLRLNAGTVFIDVFDGGATLSTEDLRQRLRATLPDESELPLAPYLRAAGEREILARMLRNLKAIHWQAQQWEAALAVVDRLVDLRPEAVEERLDRARLYERLECPRAAVADLVAYLALSASPPDAAEVRRRLAVLQQSASRLH